MSKIQALLAAVAAPLSVPLAALAALPGSQLTSFMDSQDDVWVLDAFLDPPEAA